MAGVLRELQPNGADSTNRSNVSSCTKRGNNVPPGPPVKRPKKCFQTGMKVWVAGTTGQSQDQWLCATVSGPGKGGKVNVQLDNGEVLEVSRKADSLLLAGNNNYTQVDDLTKLSPLNEAEVLESLRCRFSHSQICSKAGITLVSINPFKELPGLYGNDAVHSYHQQGSAQSEAPHVFAMAEKAFSNMRYGIGCSNQSIIVSGESGAGKTWNTRCLLKYLTSVALYKNSGGLSPAPVKSIERRILHSNPILEAFGNASTARNHNSSRFGKYIQLQFDKGSYVIGASIRTYLLEKTRLVHQAEGEGNFHIFYQILRDATDEQRLEWGLTTPDGDQMDFAYLPLDEEEQGSANENQVFATTLQAMKSVGLTLMHQDNVFQVLSGILHLGNLEFISDEEFDPCELDNKECQLSLDHACRLLGLDATGLVTSLTFRRITASHSKRQSVFMKPCSVDEAGVRRDCLAKVVYARLFDWLVEFLNQHTSANQWRSFIGLLDIYGFESFESNSLEQLCINYANEKLQQHFVTHFLRAEQEEYKKEGLTWQFCDFSDNQPCVETIEGKLSVFSLMNEECRLNRQSDPTSFEDKLLASVVSPYLTQAPVGHSRSAFAIRHYAGQVSYDVQGLIEKTKDPVPIELLEVLKASSNQFVTRLIQPELARLKELQTKGSKSTLSKTVVSKFKESLGSLMKTLNATTPHYIRCIKPNKQCRSDSFDSHFVASQLRACGVLETVAISAAGFPAKLSHAEFCQRYGILVPSGELCNASSMRDRCRLLHSLLFDGEDKENESTGPNVQQLGNTKIFLRDGQLESLEGRRLRRQSQSALIIQRAWRLHRAIAEAQRELAATLIQAAYRGWKVRQAIQTMDDAARVIQHAMLMYCIKKRQMELEISNQVLDIDDEEDEEESPSVSPKLSRKSVHFASNLTTVYSPSPLPTTPLTTPLTTPTQSLQRVVFTENSPDFRSVSPIPDHHGNKPEDRVFREEELETEERSNDEEGGVISMVTDFLKRPAVDVAIVGAVAALLITGPLRWT